MSVPPQAAAASPIADLSYRNYDGPLRTHIFRWWIVALATIRLSLRKKGFWVWSFFVLLPYLLSGFLLYFRSTMPPEAVAMLGKPHFPGFFLDSYSMSLLWIFILTLLIGASTIAGDNRTNALQIYLSKPVTKLDYLLGKWMGVFILLGAVSLAPALLLYLFCLASFFDQGFLKDHPDLWLRVIVVALLPAALHASLIVGFSAWTKRPVLAGGLYAGFYFGAGIVAGIVSLIVRSAQNADLARTVQHLSVPGILNGLAMHLLNATPGAFGMMGPAARARIQKPEFLPLLLVAVALVILALAAARARIRAVEVVRG